MQLATECGHERLSYERLLDAHKASVSIVRRTPILGAIEISQRCGGAVAFKAECLQLTGSFKLRGALNKLRSVDPATRGVVAGSAGNHAQSLAYAARHFGLHCEIYMPVDAAVSKLTAVRAFGATVHQGGSSVDECIRLALERAADDDLTFVHPFDDYDVIGGQAGLGIELAEAVPDLARVIVPIGGGGLASGVALALRRARPEADLIGVRAAACAPLADPLEAAEQLASSAARTIADGIAIKRPGEITSPLIECWYDDVASVDENDLADAIIHVLKSSKLLVEGAGAAAVAALLSGSVKPAKSGTTVAVLSGGNIDVSLLLAIAARAENRAGRRARLFTRVGDRPGGLAALLSALATSNANVLAVEHVRDGVDLAVRETGVVLTVETRGSEHLQKVVASLAGVGYRMDVVGG